MKQCNVKTSSAKRIAKTILRTLAGKEFSNFNVGSGTINPNKSVVVMWLTNNFYEPETVVTDELPAKTANKVLNLLTNPDFIRAANLPYNQNCKPCWCKICTKKGIGNYCYTAESRQ